MSATRYAKTLDELAGCVGLSERQIRKYLAREGAPVKGRAGYSVKKVQTFIKEVKEQGLTGDGSLRDEKTLREIEFLDLKIAKESGELVSRSETENHYRAKLQRYRSIIDAWTEHESAKHPEAQDLIDTLSKSLLENMVNDGAA